MKNLLLLIVGVLFSANIFSQEDCPTTLECLSSVTISISERNEIPTSFFLENGVAYDQCNSDSIFISYTISNVEGEQINYSIDNQKFDCSFTPGIYIYSVERLEVLPDGEVSEGITCFGELSLVDINNVCPGVDAGFDVNVIVDCTSSDVVGVAGDFLDVKTGENICVPFYARNFKKMISVQTGIKWNPSVLTFTNFKEESLSDVEFNDNNVNDGELRFVWLPLSPEDVLTIEDDEVLFQLCFDVIGNESEYSKVSMERIGDTLIEFVRNDAKLEEVDYCISPALVNVIGAEQSISDYSAIINGEEVAVNQHSVMAIPSSQINKGENTIEFVTNDVKEYLNGVSTLDLVLGLRMFILDDPVDPIQAIALDMDYSGGINVKDLVLMRQLILGIRQELPHPGKFFLKTDHVFSSDFDEFSYGYFNSYTFNSNEYNEGQLYFKSYNYGDLNGSANFKDQETEIRSNHEKLIFTNQYLQSGSTAKIKFQIDGKNSFEISGLQSSLQFNDSEVISVEHNYSDSEFLNHIPRLGIVNLLYASREPKQVIEFEVVIKPNSDGFLSDIISLNNDINGELVKDDLTTSGVKLTMKEESSEDFKISPNPFSEFTIVKIPGEYIGGTLTVNTILGKKLYDLQIVDNEISISSGDLSHPGVYLVSIQKANRLVTKRVVLN